MSFIDKFRVQTSHINYVDRFDFARASDVKLAFGATTQDIAYSVVKSHTFTLSIEKVVQAPDRHFGQAVKVAERAILMVLFPKIRNYIVLAEQSIYSGDRDKAIEALRLIEMDIYG